jgi:hypothetical protein
MSEFAKLLGKIITATSQEGDDVLRFFTSDGKAYWMGHHQDCCESVEIKEIVGDMTDLIGSPVTMVEEVESPEAPPGFEQGYESNTWTFYKLATIKGGVTITWHGNSNGYYSESVDFVELNT